MAVKCNLTAYEVSNSIDVADNSTKIYVKLTATTTGESFNNYSPSGSITIDGTKHNFSKNIPKNTTTTLYEATHTIKHDGEGKKSVAISYSFATGISAGTLTGSKTLQLTTIPRTSTVTCADANIGSSTTININRANTSFTHTLKYMFGSLTGTIVEKTSEASIGWTMPTSFYSQIPNDNSGYGTISCDTYSGDTLIGTSSCNFNAYVTNSNPSISATITDVNSSTVALTGDSNKLIKYYSNAEVVISSTAKNSASIVNQQVVCGNKSGTSQTNILNNVESGVFDLSCTDSRGNVGNTRITKTMVEYVKLAFTQINLTRPSTTSSTINVSLKGNYFNSNFGKVSNELTLKWRWRIKNGSWNSYSTLNASKSGNTFSYSGTLGTVFDFNKEYEFEFQVVDKLATITNSKSVTRGEPIIDIGKEDVKVNGEIYKNNVRVLASTELYNNSTGTTGTVSLSKSASDFNFLEIYYHKEGLNTSCKVCDPNGKSATLMFSQFTTDKVYQGASKKVTISGTSISVSTTQSGFGNIIDGATDDVTQGQENAIYITKVVGCVA